MLTINRSLVVFAIVSAVLAASISAHAADSYTVDSVHSSISFKIMHAEISFIHGRFNDYTGKFVIDKSDPSKSSFTMSIKTESVDTGNKARDTHLQQADYFDCKQFPTMTYQSKDVKAIDGGYEVSGELTLHGVTKPLTIMLKGGEKEVEFPEGTSRIGFETTLVVKRSEFGLKAGMPSVGDDVHIVINVEGTKDK